MAKYSSMFWNLPFTRAVFRGVIPLSYVVRLVVSRDLPIWHPCFRDEVLQMVAVEPSLRVFKTGRLSKSVIDHHVATSLWLRAQGGSYTMAGLREHVAHQWFCTLSDGSHELDEARPHVFLISMLLKIWHDIVCLWHSGACLGPD